MWLLRLAASVLSIVVGGLLIVMALPALFDDDGGPVMALGFSLFGFAVLYVSLTSLWRLGNK